MQPTFLATATLVTVVLTSLAMTEARSVAASAETSSGAVPSSSSSSGDKAASSSHLLFYLTVEKELLPQSKDLAARALHILEIKCSEFYNKTSECLMETERLPEIPALGNFPSVGALDREGSKVFSKHLLKDVHRALLKLQVLLEEENGAGIEPLTQLTAHMDRTRRQLQEQMDLFYKARLHDRDSYPNLIKSKKRYIGRSRFGDDDCRRRKDNNDNDDDDNDNDDCLTEDDYRLRLLYTAYRQLLRVHHVLGYTVRLSWLALEDDQWPR